MSQIFYSVEFDPAWNGVGNYSGTGNFLLIPEESVQGLTLPVAFNKLTGHDPVNIVKSVRVYMDEDLGTLSLIEAKENSDILKETLASTSEPILYEAITEDAEYEEIEEEDLTSELFPDTEEDENVDS